MKKTACWTAALLFLLAGARLSGQSYRLFREEFAEIQERARFHLGPLRLRPEFRLTDIGYDSNVYFQEDAGEVVPDFTATISPLIWGHVLLGGSVILSVMENPEYLHYAQESELRAFTNSFSTGLRMLLLRSFSLAGEYHDLSHVRRSTPELEQRIQDTATGGTAGFFFETARGTALGIKGSVDDFRYEEIASGVPDDIYAQSLDRRETAAAFEFYYRAFSRSYLFTTVVWTRYAFLHPDSAWRDAADVEVSGGIRFPLLGRARGTFGLGWKAFQPESPERLPFSGFVAATDVAFRFGRIELDLSFARDIEFSYYEDAFYYVDGRARAGLAFYFSPSFKIGGSVLLGAMTYPEPQEVWYGGEVYVIDRRQDVYRDIAVGPVVRLAGTVGLGLTYNIYRRTSNAPGFDVRRNFFGAYLTYEF